MKDIKTLGELKASGYQTKSIKDELRDNLILKIKNKEKIFSLKDKGKLEELIKKYNF